MKIPIKEYARRRKAMLALMDADSIAIIPSAKIHVRNRDVDHVFRQDSDFWYLTGHVEPCSVLVLLPGREQGESILFCNERDPLREQWDGLRLGQEGVVDKLGMDDAFPIADIDEILPGMLEGRSRVYYAMGKDKEFDANVMEWLNQLRSQVRSGAEPPGEFVDLDHHLHELRLIKSAAEIKQMQSAATISARAHCKTMQACKPNSHEYELEAELLHEFMRSGARSVAYPSIVGAGNNACILHYIENCHQAKAGDLVLIDAGCELDGYASDITRTFPSSGKFSAPQKALYDVVLAAQIAAIDCVRPGRSWNEAHDVTVQIITEGLVELGLLKGDVAILIEAKAYNDFYMHRAGHWLGMDVHDVGSYRIDDQWRELEVGMVLTVEPGIYVSPDNQNVDKKWRGIGIRIEDDVVVTAAEPLILTSAVPKTTEAIEALMTGSV